jgi:hypothetical protein
MKDDSRQAEDVAAVLQGKVRCPACGGIGTIGKWSSRKDPDAERVDDDCWGCEGRRWMTEEERRKILAAYDDGDSDYRDVGMEEWTD